MLFEHCICRKNTRNQKCKKKKECEKRGQLSSEHWHSNRVCKIIGTGILLLSYCIWYLSDPLKLFLKNSFCLNYLIILFLLSFVCHGRDKARNWKSYYCQFLPKRYSLGKTVYMKVFLPIKHPQNQCSSCNHKCRGRSISLA